MAAAPLTSVAVYVELIFTSNISPFKSTPAKVLNSLYLASIRVNQRLLGLLLYIHVRVVIGSGLLGLLRS